MYVLMSLTITFTLGTACQSGGDEQQHATPETTQAAELEGVDVRDKGACLQYLNGRAFSEKEKRPGHRRMRLRFSQNTAQLSDADSNELIARYDFLRMGSFHDTGGPGQGIRELFLSRGNSVTQMGLFGNGQIIEGQGQDHIFFDPE